jgi:putative protease
MRRQPIDIAAFGHAGAPLKLVFKSTFGEVVARSNIALVPATKRALDVTQLREQAGRLGETTFVLRDVEAGGLAEELFLPVSELNRMRQTAVAELTQRAQWDSTARFGERGTAISLAIANVDAPQSPHASAYSLAAHVYNVDDARTAADAGASEIVLDPFLRHPTPPLARVRALADELATRSIGFRLRTPSVVRPEDRASVDRWLALDLPIVTGHAGLAVELASAGRDVVADYAINCFNQHTASYFFSKGVRRIVPSIELTTDELGALVAPWQGRGFDVLIYGRPEGMTIEHCVLSAAFDRVPTTCRDLCVQKHPNVAITDPAGYTFAVATDSACRNRLLHSRPVEASEFVPLLWNAGIRSFNAVFNVVGDPIAEIVRGYRDMIDALAAGEPIARDPVRSIVGSAFTRGHFARAV